MRVVEEAQAEEVPAKCEWTQAQRSQEIMESLQGKGVSSIVS